MKKIFLTAAIAILALGTMAFMAISTKAAVPTGTLTGTPITINIGERAALPTLTVTAPNPNDITDEHDIRIWAIHIGTQIIWDESVTTFTPGGTAAEKVSGSITYEKYLGSAENVVAVIEVISDFDPGDTLEINGLGVIAYSGGGVGQALNWSVDGSSFRPADNSTRLDFTTAGDEDNLANVQVGVSNSVKSQENVTYTVQFTLPGGSYIPKNGIFKITFPVGTVLTNATFTTNLFNLGDFALNKNNNILTVTRNGEGPAYIGSPTDITFTISGVTNTAVAAANKQITVENQTSGGGFLASGISVPFVILETPAAIIDLTCESSGQAGAIWLRFTEPDGAAAGTYIVKHSAVAITEGDWNSGTVVPQNWIGKAKGVARQELAAGLTPNNRYYFAIKSAAAVGAYESDISNSISCIAPSSAPANIDNTAPVTLFVSPVSGSTVKTGTILLKGTARDTGGSSVQKIEISLDNGTTWREAAVVGEDGADKLWEYAIQNAKAGIINVLARSIDWTGNVETPISVTLTVSENGEDTTVTPIIPSVPSGATPDQIRSAITIIRQQLVLLIQQLIQRLIAELRAIL